MTLIPARGPPVAGPWPARPWPARPWPARPFRGRWWWPRNQSLFPLAARCRSTRGSTRSSGAAQPAIMREPPG